MKKQTYNLRSPKDPKFPHQRGYVANISAPEEDLSQTSKNKQIPFKNKSNKLNTHKRNQSEVEKNSFEKDLEEILKTYHQKRLKKDIEIQNEDQRIQTQQPFQQNISTQNKQNEKEPITIPSKKEDKALQERKENQKEQNTNYFKQSDGDDPQKKINKSTSDYIQVLLQQLETKPPTYEQKKEPFSAQQIQNVPQAFSNPQKEEGGEGELPKRRYKKITQADLIGKTSGRWTRQEHIRFIQALKLFGKDWKKVEDYIGTRTGAQIRSHAQKYFLRIEKELNGNPDDLGDLGSQDQDDYTQELDQDMIEQEAEEVAQISKNVESAKNEIIQICNEEDKKMEQKDTDKISEASVSTTERGGQNILQPNIRERFYSMHSDYSAAVPQMCSNENSLNAIKKSAENLDWTKNTFKNLLRIQQQKFEDIVKKKETIMQEMYLGDKDLFSEAKKYSSQLGEIFSEIQQLAFLNSALQKTFQISNACNNQSQFLEKILICLADISNIQKVLQDFVQNIHSNLSNSMSMMSSMLGTSLQQAPNKQIQTNINKIPAQNLQPALQQQNISSQQIMQQNQLLKALGFMKSGSTGISSDQSKTQNKMQQPSQFVRIPGMTNNDQSIGNNFEGENSTRQSGTIPQLKRQDSSGFQQVIRALAGTVGESIINQQKQQHIGMNLQEPKSAGICAPNKTLQLQPQNQKQ